MTSLKTHRGGRQSRRAFPGCGRDRVYVLSHSAPNITAIDTADGAIVGTVNLDAAVEETKSDGKGHLYVALEDKDAVGVVDTKTLTVTARYPLGAKAARRRAWRWMPKLVCCLWPAAIRR